MMLTPADWIEAIEFLNPKYSGMQMYLISNFMWDILILKTSSFLV